MIRGCHFFNVFSPPLGKNRMTGKRGRARRQSVHSKRARLRCIHDWLEATFGAGQNPAEFDGIHKMFKVSRLLIGPSEGKAAIRSTAPPAKKVRQFMRNERE